VTLIHPSSVTHAWNMGQTINELAFTASGSGLEVVAPERNALAPPGYYMLFLVDSNGVPSVARMIQVGYDGESPQTEEPPAGRGGDDQGQGQVSPPGPGARADDSEESKGGCSCSTASSPALWTALALALPWVRRRRPVRMQGGGKKGRVWGWREGSA
jgi:MYXO-CTERM domain-containing protein